jgi:hypothetical protein
MILNELKRHDEARAQFEDCIALCKEIGSRRTLASALDSLACLEADTGNDGPALAHCLEAVALNRELGTTASLLTNLGLVARLKAPSDRARALNLAGLILAHASANNEGKGRANEVLANLKASAPTAGLPKLEDAVARELAAK